MFEGSVKRFVLVMAVLSGLTAAIVVVWRAYFGPGYVVVLLHNSGASQVEDLLIDQLGETYREVKGEAHRVRVRAGGTVELHIQPRGDAVLRVRFFHAGQAGRSFVVEEYLSPPRGIAIQLDVADGRLTRARARPGGSAEYENAKWKEE